MESIPVVAAFAMLKKEKSILTKKVKYKNKSYRLRCFEITPNHVLKLQDLDGKAAMRIGVVQDGKSMVELHGSSISLDDLKSILSKNPYIAILEMHKGTKEDGEKRFISLTSAAFKDINKHMTILKKLLKKVISSKSKKDSQRNKLYAWEHKFFILAKRDDPHWKRFSVSELRKFAKRIISHFKLPKDKILLDNSSTRSKTRMGVTHTYKDDFTSENPAFSYVKVHDSTIDTLLHELVHVVVNHKIKLSTVSAHGPEFCGIYAHMLGLFTKFEEEEVIESMQKHGLKVKRYSKDTEETKEISA
jgi:hypothetical protein